MTAGFPSLFSPEQARSIMESMRVRASAPQNWNGACLWFTGADCKPYAGLGKGARFNDTSYAMFVLQRAGNGISAKWSEIRNGKRADSRYDYTDIRYDPGLNALSFCRRGSGPDIIPIEGEMRGIRAVSRPSSQRRLEDF